MNELEQTLPEEKQDETRPVTETETIEVDSGATNSTVTDSGATDSGAPYDTSLDITMGDMETDLPVASSDAVVNDVASDTAAQDEMEIPWGDMS